MKIRNGLSFVVGFSVALLGVGNAFAVPYRVSRLSPDSFNKMYYIASQGGVGILREAISRGLYIDAVNRNDDTGLCVAIKRNNHVAYNSFRMSGANPRHRCTYRIQKQYEEFLNSGKVAKAEEIVGNKESLYYTDADRGFWPWIMAGGVIGAGALALSGGGGSSGGVSDDGIVTTRPDEGIVTLMDNYTKNVKNGESVSNTVEMKANNPSYSVARDKIQFLPNMLNNKSYLNAYVKVEDGGEFFNGISGISNSGGIVLGDRWLGTSGDGAVAIAVTGEDSKGVNYDNIKVEAYNGAIGMASSNGGSIENGYDKGDEVATIDIIFRGSKEGDAIIGMLADTHSEAINYGTIVGTTSDTEDNLDNSEEEASQGSNYNSSGSGNLIDDVLGDSSESEDEEEETEEEKVVSKNSGTILGMGLFDYYTGTNHSNEEVLAKNYGTIDLKAGYNGASEIGVSLIGMGSYIDDNFLKGNNNPNYAEKMKLNNYGDIKLSYQGQYTIAEDALKLGDGGLIGMRADAQSEATNAGNINIDMQATTMDSGVDVAAGMLSVHGAKLTNASDGTITMQNEATSGGVSYGMLAAKGDGSQSSIYKWQTPTLENYGTINMYVSNSNAMASFAGGDVTNEGEINLGIESGHSYYKGNVGLYAAGSDKTEEVVLTNSEDGIINVFSESSSAMKSDYSGSVTMINKGTINVSNKATSAKVFDGYFSKAENTGSILYKVDNSSKYSYPILNDGTDRVAAVKEAAEPIDYAVVVSENTNKGKQYFINNGTIQIGEVLDQNKDYGGTYGVAGVAVNYYGGALNNGDINVVNYSSDRGVFNVGMYLSSTATTESYIRNNGTITVDGRYSVGMRTDSEEMADATNYSDIYVNSEGSAGMAVTNERGVIYNGRIDSSVGHVVSNRLSVNDISASTGFIDENGSLNLDKDSTADIVVNGKNSVAMYVGGTAYNYGNIYLNGDGSTAFQVYGEEAQIYNAGNIYRNPDVSDLAIYWFLGGTRTFLFKKSEQPNVDEKGFLTINDITYARLSAGAKATLSDISDVKLKISGDQGRFVKIEEAGGTFNNNGNITVTDGAIGVETNLAIRDDASGANIANLNSGIINVEANSIGISGYGITTGSEAKIENYGDIYVSGSSAIGIKASGYSNVSQAGAINVEEAGVGVDAIGGGVSVDTLGTVNVSGSESIGYNISNGASYSGNGLVQVSGGGTGIHIASNGTITAADTVSVNGSGSIGYDIDYGNTVEVSGSLSVYNGGVGIYNEQGTVEVSGGLGVSDGSIGIYSKGSVRNTGTITARGQNSIGVEVNGGSFSNAGTINVDNGKGVYASGSTVSVENSADISVSGSGYGMYAANSGAVTNAQGGAITVSGSGYGMYAANGGSAYNYGTIEISGSGTGMYAASGGTATNNGTINYDSTLGGKCGNAGGIGDCIDSSAETDGATATTEAVNVSDIVNISDGGTFINNGLFSLRGLDVDFDELRDETSKYIIAENGKYEADTLKGEVWIGKDVVMNGFEDTYKKQEAFVGENEGLSVKSQSYMFDVFADTKDDVTDVELNRKKFEDLIEDEKVAEFLEVNYNLHNNEKMYAALKSAETKKEFDETKQSETGEKFYANLPRENVAVVRGLNSQEQNRILNDGVVGTVVGADYLRTGKDGNDKLSGYDTDVYSAYVGYGDKINKNWSMGATLKVGYVDSSYNEANASRNNKILMAFMPILYQNNNVKFLTMPSLGVGFGEYERNAVSGKYEADTFDVYYGLYNHGEYSIDLKIAELVTEAELNLQGIEMGNAKEDNGLKLKSDSLTSLEAGIGVKLRKQIKLAKERSLMLSLGTKYYHEFLDPYKKLSIGMSGSPVDMYQDGYDETKNRLRTAAEAVYKDGDLSIAAEIAHNAEEESSVEGGVGVRYNF